jgi:bacillolysin
MKKLFITGIALLLFIAPATAQKQVNSFDARSKQKNNHFIEKPVIHGTIQGKRFPKSSIAPSALTRVQKNGTTHATQIIREQAHTLPLFIKKEAATESAKFKTNSVFEARELAHQFLAEVKDLMQIKQPADEWKVSSISQDELNNQHTRLEQVYQGIPVYGAEIILHAKNGVNEVMNGRYFPTPELSSASAGINSADAIRSAIKELQSKTKWKELNEVQSQLCKYKGPEAKLVVYHVNQDASKEKITWHIKIKPNWLESWNVFIDANTGEVLHSFNNACTINGPKTASGNDLNGVNRTINTYEYNGSFYLIDASRSMYNSSQSSLPNDPVGAIWTIDAQNTPGNSIYNITTSTNSGWNNKAISAHYNAGIAFDYYKNTHNRNSINAQGGTITSVINVSDDDGSGLDNAYWTGEMMCYGNGKFAFKPLAGSLDVAGHEMTHGVVQNTANLEYQGQSGAINESMADIFGCMMDRNDWLIGEEVVKTQYYPSGALRSMQDPHNGGNNLNDDGYQPRVMSEYYTGTQDNGGVHINSGIPNWAFYKYATAITKEKAEKVYYRALNNYLTKTSQFVDLRIAVVQSAIDLYGNNTPEVNEAKNAFNAVGIYATDPGGGGSGGGGTNTAVDLPVNPGQDYILSYDENTSDPVTLYSSSITGTNYVSKSQRNMKRKPSVVDNGSSCVFVGTDSKIYSLNLTGTASESVISSQTIWDNVAIAKDASKLAAITSNIDTSIYIYDYNLQQWKQFILYNPTFSEGVDAGGVLYADALEWDYSGQYIIYDAKNVISNPFGDDIEYWDIGMIKVWDNATNTWGDGSVQKLYTQLPEDVSIGNPTFAKNSPYIIAFDYIDSYNNVNAILAKNIITGDDDLIYTNTVLGFPDYSKLDNKILFNAEDVNNNPIVAQIGVTISKIKGSGSASVLVPDAKWGIWYSQGTRSLKSSGKDLTSFSFPSLTPAANATITGTNVSVTVPSTTNISALIASFSVSPLAQASIGSTKQISSVTSNNFTNPVIYTIKAEDGTTKNYTVTVSKNTGVGTISRPAFNIYPNPANSTFTVDVKGNFTYELIDISGKSVRKGNGQDKEVISIADIAKGIYILRLTTPETNNVSRLVKE